ncbi:hypothetical protein J3A64_000513 [Pseudarthrobacter sp. PvP004]|uniref:hypothetical protein n=1 Tax=Pseudarthrobacter sp. PvP004 TaxID=2817850 RepID=UPI001AE72CFF|nr:hypothetical protein [Pseudarthrobacter sp. PvP004]MBP2265049.1 hypothetical protein [Pseudarthrobacter sp. PvP004]
MKNLVSAASPRRSLRDRIQTDMYLTRLDWHLEAVLTGKERRATVKELRQALAGDPRDTPSSLRDLGSPKTLARQYAVDDDRRPLWSIGIITAGLALLVYSALFLAFTFGMVAAVDANTPMEAHATFFFVDVTAFSSPDSVGMGWTSSWAWLIVPAIIGVVALLLGARSWRIFNRR